MSGADAHGKPPSLAAETGEAAAGAASAPAAVSIRWCWCVSVSSFDQQRSAVQNTMADRFSAWAERVEAEELEAKEMEFRRTVEAEEMKQVKARLAKRKFRVWVQRKDRYERGLELFKRLDHGRGGPQAEWEEVGIALAAIDLSIGVGTIESCRCRGICRNPDHKVRRQSPMCKCFRPKCLVCRRCVTGNGPTPSDCSKAEDMDGKPIQRPCNCPLRSMGEHFIPWTKEHHTFSSLEVTEKQIAGLSEGARDMLLESRYDPEEERRVPVEPLQLASLPWTKGKSKIPSKRADERVTNAIFLSTTKRAWARFRNTVLQRVEDYVQNGLRQFADKRAKAAAGLGDEGDAAGDGDGDDGVEESKGGGRHGSEGKGGDEAGDGGGDGDGDGDGKPSAATYDLSALDDDMQRQAWKLESRCLQKLGVHRLMEWVEIDVDAKAEAEKEEARAQESRAKSTHEMWSRQKDRLRIRMPTKSAAGPPPRMDFSSRGLARIKGVVSRSTSVDIMRGSGLKFVHALPKGDDLQRSRAALLKKGIVYEENFDEDSDDEGDTPRTKARRERARNAARADRKKESMQRSERAETSYVDWARVKAMVSSAKACIGILPPPDNTAKGIRLWLDVGKALKQVDRSLLDTWVTWSSTLKTASACKREWDFFEPRACDLHSLSSPLRTFFVQLLNRKGTDYKEAFELYMDELWKKRVIREGLYPEDRDLEEESRTGMTAREFMRFMRYLGIKVMKDHVCRIVQCFDRNGDGKISIAEFLTFTGNKRKRGGDAMARLSVEYGVHCVWQGACHQCGMPNAYSVAIDRSKTGLSLRRTDLPDHRPECTKPGHRRHPDRSCASCRLMLRQRAKHDDDRTEPPPGSCPASSWGLRDRQYGLDFLKQCTSTIKERRSVEKRLVKGTAPPPPILEVVRRAGDSEGAIMLRLKWSPKSSRHPPTFYLLETCGAEGSRTHRDNHWWELCRDPPSAAEGEPVGGTLVKTVATKGRESRSLLPNTRYYFRLRAFNLYGASGFAYGRFFTAPAPPAVPKLVSCTPEALVVSWKGHHPVRALYDTVLALQASMESEEEDPIGDELVAEIDKQPKLRTWVKEEPAEGGVVLYDALAALGGVTWQAVVDCMADRAQVNAVLGEASGGGRKAGRSVTRYVLLRCLSDEDDTWAEVYTGKEKRATVASLKGGKCYKFRVLAINDECGLQSKPSAAAVLTTAITGPDALKLVGGAEAVEPTALRLRWSSLRSSHGKSEESIAKLMADWATDGGATSVEDRGVSIRKAFNKYDADRSGFIERRELEALLLDLGGCAKPWMIDDALNDMDTDDSGSISFEEFSAWWSASRTIYTVKRTVGVSDDSAGAVSSRSLSSSSGRPVELVYRGPLRSIEVTGLQPNTNYTFRVQSACSQSLGGLSPSLSVSTRPLPPSRAVVVESAARSMTLKWYPGDGGALKYVLECQFKEVLPGERKNKPDKARAEWTKVYEGADTLATVAGLVPNTVYRFRLRAFNRDFLASDSSFVTQVNTMEEDLYEPLKKSNAHKFFDIECFGDVLIGDTLLFTEQLFASSSASAAATSSSRRRLSSSLPRPSSSRGKQKYIAERTVAATVVRERWSKRKASGKRTRQLGLDVHFASVSKKSAASTFALRPGTHITRNHDDLFKYQVFRRAWQEEDKRDSFIELMEEDAAELTEPAASGAGDDDEAALDILTL
eukprot:PLAT5301.1.p1 GENE.PLAT5301.1~~PLAT5301.1.p1  ORF type:complete len:1695 (-),score=549.45 PLAT5301.1:82-5166(-)